jgi:hypothetical protein
MLVHGPSESPKPLSSVARKRCSWSMSVVRRCACSQALLPICHNHMGLDMPFPVVLRRFGQRLGLVSGWAHLVVRFGYRLSFG